MTTDRLEKAFYFLSLAVFATAMLLFVNDSLLFGKRGTSQDEIAFVKSSTNDIRVKGKGEMEFLPVAKEDELYHQDLVYSGESSFADIQLNTGGRIKLNPNSLVILKKKSKNLAFELKEGEFQGKLKKGQRIRLLENGKIRTIEGELDSSFIVQKNKNQEIKVKVLSGTVSMESKGVNTKLRKNQTLKVSENNDEVSVTDIDLLRPHHGEEIWKKKNSVVYFSWYSKENQRIYRFILSRDPSYKTTLLDKIVKKQNLSVRIPKAGTYYWKVVQGAESKSLNAGADSMFVVNEEIAPKLIHPPVHTKFKISSKGNDLKNSVFAATLVIKDSTDAEIFMAQVSTDENFKSIILEQEFTGDRLTDIKLGAGEYYWRARIIDEKRNEALWSKTSTFYIEKELKYNPLIPPDLQFSKSEITIPNNIYPSWLYKADRKKTNEFLLLKGSLNSKISWNKLGYPSEFEYQFFTPQGLPLSPLKSTKENQATIKDFFPTRKLLKVRSVLKGKRSEWSQPISVMVSLEPPKNQSPPIFSSYWDGINKKGNARLKWTSLLFAQKYELIISRDRSFAKNKSFVTKRNWFPLMIYWNKSYFWKVRALDDNSSPISKFSKVFSFKAKKKETITLSSIPNDQKMNQKREISSLDATTTKVTLNDLKSIGKTKMVPNYWFWGGMGYNYVRYTQNEDDSSNLTFNSVKSPSIYLSGGMYFNNSLGVEAGYKDSVGEIDNSSNSQSTFAYRWKTQSLEGLYKSKEYLRKGEYFNGYQFVWRMGLQNHQIPFLSNVNSSSQTVDLEENNLLMTSVGGTFILSVTQRIRYEMLFRYQYPLSSRSGTGNTFDVTPSFAFDGSLGATYKMSDNFFLGAYWYGQWHQFRYNSTGLLGPSSGENDLFFSNFDLRLGIEY